MDAISNIEIQNLQGRFVHAWNQRNFLECAALFAKNANARFQAPDDGILLTSQEAIRNGLAEAAQRMGVPFLMSHTPAIRQDAPDRARASWYLSTVQFTDDGCVQGSARLDADLIRVQQEWRYLDVQLYYMMTLEPETGRGMTYDSTFSERIAFPDAPRGKTSAVDYLTLRNMLGRWCHNRREGAEDWFAGEGEPRLEYPPFLSKPLVGREAILRGLRELRKQETAVAPIPLTIPMLTTPCIETWEDSAWGSWFVISHDYLLDGDGAGWIAHRVGQLLVTWVRERGEWKIRELRLCPLFSLPSDTLLLEDSGDTILNMEGGWLNAPAPSGRTDPEAAEEALTLEEYIAFWVSGLRYRSEAPFYYSRLDIDNPEELTYRLGRRPAKRGLGEVTEEIFAMTSKFSTLQPKSPGNHTGTTPVIEISPDGTHAVAVWLDYGWTTQAEVFGITKPPYFANPAIGRYEHHYKKRSDGWKLYSFHWAPYYRTGKWRFDYATTKGWCGTTSSKRFPLPLDTYTYEDDEAKRGQPVVLDPPMIDCPYERPWTGETDRL